MKRKTNPELVETIMLAKKQNMIELAKKLSAPTRQQAKINVETLDKLKEKEIIVAGKVLGNGNIDRKLTVYALSFSEQAKEKLKKAGCEIKTIYQGLKDKKIKDGVLI